MSSQQDLPVVDAMASLRITFSSSNKQKPAVTADKSRYDTVTDAVAEYECCAGQIPGGGTAFEVSN